MSDPQERAGHLLSGFLVRRVLLTLFGLAVASLGYNQSTDGPRFTPRHS
jgi:hypothetical protein